MVLSCDRVIVSRCDILLVSGRQAKFEMNQKVLTESVDEVHAKLRPIEHEKGSLEDEVEDINYQLEDEVEDINCQLEDELRQRQSLQTQITNLQRQVVGTAASESTIQVFIAFSISPLVSH